ncbi:energy transducer TonB [Brevundimonas aurantiaca]|uniref:energy transducer TonB n=1 Tax=Brevundimonas aurantiaca TaxID=74316 RepID=UPI00174D3412|nr:energy transducer TonB [Brevundimonas aurantiaca]
MTDVTYHRSRYDVPKAKGFMGVSYPVLIVCLLIVTLLFALLIFFLQQSKFKLKEFNYVDESVEVELVEPVPPPPPVNITPTKKEDRVEYTGPPVVVPGPPPPPAPPAPPKPSVITNVQWARQPRPTADDFPARALEREISGSATVECTARANGSPANCRVVSEEPAGMGFGRAAIRVVQRGQLSPRTVDGAAQDATFRVRVPFTLG